ncbi:MAG: serine/threonine protein kinase, partial [Deltaproteobacteria bacterium]|nr:serine/threonine protein kinase [Deltaproteobacteria bacterium]
MAVKFLREMDSRCDRERFMREARVLSRIRHPHIIQLFDAGLLDRAPYLVLELMEGDNLRSLLSRQAPLAVDRALSIAISCLEALETCHGAGIIHRDLKPDNILLSDGGEPRITDFGLVTDPGSPSNLTAPGEVVGTPAYLSPETIQG